MGWMLVISPPEPLGLNEGSGTTQVSHVPGKHLQIPLSRGGENKIKIK